MLVSNRDQITGKLISINYKRQFFLILQPFVKGKLHYVHVA